MLKTRTEQIVNFAVRRDFETVPVPIGRGLELRRCRWLTKPLLWLLNLLCAKWIDKVENISRVIIEPDKIPNDVYALVKNMERYSNKRVKTLVVGWDWWEKIARMEPTQPCFQTLYFDTRAFMGFKIIVHPFINGIVPLEEECC